MNYFSLTIYRFSGVKAKQKRKKEKKKAFY